MQLSEPDGFRAFVDASSRPLLRSAWLLTGDWAAAEDLVQAPLAATWTHWSVARQAPAAYTQRVMTRTYLRWRRRRWTDELPTADVPESCDVRRCARKAREVGRDEASRSVAGT